MPGPVPNRSTDLSRERDVNRGNRAPLTKGVLRPVNSIPEPDPEWSDLSRDLYLSALDSGQSDYYQMSDWYLWWSLCEDLNYYKKATKRSGQMLQTIYSAMERLLVAEGDRRRVRIELTAPEPEEDDAAVLALVSYREALGIEDESDEE